MNHIFVVNNPKEWPLDIPGVEVTSARAYLTDPAYGAARGVKVFNLCRSYRYQNLGYYVSLLAAARNHKPLPSIDTIQDLKSGLLQRYAAEELQPLIDRSLGPIHSETFTLSIYFGRNLARRHERLSDALFRMFPAPMLRAEFARGERWELRSLRPVALNEVTAEHYEFVREAAMDYFNRKRTATHRRDKSRFDLAILWDPKEEESPSNERAIQKFVRAAEKLDFAVEIIGQDDYGRLAEFDALFIRQTTAVNHFTYRFARRAVADGLVVIDDPISILRCCNKVFLAEVLSRCRVRTPKTVMLHRDNIETLEAAIGLPCILKQPDSQFSRGVVKASTREELEQQARALLERSDLVIAQEFVPTEFDWRVGVIDNEPIFAARYTMPRGHWQIVQRNKDGTIRRWGEAHAVPVQDVPHLVVEAARRAAAAIGNGLYGVDVKEVHGKAYVIEVNDNPTIESGYEDAILKDALYMRIMETFLKRVERRKEKKAS